MFENRRSAHQIRVQSFMLLAGQDVPEFPIVPSRDVRLLRVRLLVEEVLEHAKASGISVVAEKAGDVDMKSLHFGIYGAPNLVKMIDANADISVVNIGAMLACGVSDESVLEEVDKNNLAKFGPGGYRNELGKWIKPPGHKPPDILGVLIHQGLGHQ